MDEKSIKFLIDEGQPVCDCGYALGIIRKEVHEVFVKTGMHRRLNADDYSNEVSIISGLLLQDFRSDKLYRTMRIGEVGYCFSNGLKGRLGDNRNFDITYESLIRWVEAYVRHPARVAALEAHNREEYERKRLNEKKLIACPKYDAEAETKKAFEDYCKYRERMSRMKASSKEPRRIGDLSVPISCLDHGGMKMEWLRSRGLSGNRAKLVEIFAQRYDGGERDTNWLK